MHFVAAKGRAHFQFTNYKAEVRGQTSELTRPNSSPYSLRWRKILMHFVTAKGRAHFQFTNLSRLRVEHFAALVSKTEKRARHGFAGAYRADLPAVECPIDVKMEARFQVWFVFRVGDGYVPGLIGYIRPEGKAGGRIARGGLPLPEKYSHND